MRPKVVIYKQVDEKVLNFVEEYADVTSFKKLDEKSYPAFLTALREAHGLLGSGLRVDKELLDMAPNLQIVCNTSVGYDNLDMKELSARGIMASNTPDVLNETVADLIFGLMIATARRMTELDAAIRADEWKYPAIGSWLGVDVHHKTLGIIGFGAIGAAIAKRAYHGFSMNILYHNRSRNDHYEQQYQAVYCSLEQLLQQSDFVCLMTPLTEESYGMMGEREFGLMKKSAIFINGSRGATVNEEALVKALQDGTILGAGLDVFVQEPLPDGHPLTELKNTVLTPHIGSATEETRQAMGMLAAQNLVAGLTGKEPPTLVKWEQ